jgi:hypothetical protein
MEQNTEGPTNSDTWYRASFTLPSSFLNPSLNVRIHADNYAEIYLNSPPNNLADPAHLVGMQPNQQIVDNFRDPPESFTANTPLQPGTNTIYFKIHNFDETTAFDYQVKVYCRMVPGGGLGPGPIGNVSGPLPPTTSGNVTCPAKNVQHWDKIVFQITDSGVAGSLGFLTDTPLDIKVLDDPKTVADIEKKVLDFLKLPDNPQNRNAIFVVDVEYAIICAR